MGDNNLMTTTSLGDHTLTLRTPLSGDEQTVMADLSGAFRVPLRTDHDLMFIYGLSAEQARSLGETETTTVAVAGLLWRWKLADRLRLSLGGTGVHVGIDGCETDQGETSCYAKQRLNLAGVMRWQYRDWSLRTKGFGTYATDLDEWVQWGIRVSSELSLPSENIPLIGAGLTAIGVDNVLLKLDYDYRNRFSKGDQHQFPSSAYFTWNINDIYDVTAGVSARYNSKDDATTITPSIGVTITPIEGLKLSFSLFFGEPDFVGGGE